MKPNNLSRCIRLTFAHNAEPGSPLPLDKESTDKLGQIPKLVRALVSCYGSRLSGPTLWGGVAAYTAAGQRAFADVENALAANVALQARAKQLDARVLENRRQVELAGHRLRVGSVDRRALINEELGLIAVQGEQLRVQSDARVQRVNLHLALGGDFAPAAPVAAATQ